MSGDINKIKHMGIMTTEEHKVTLRAWLGAVSGSSLWVVDEQNPDLDTILRNFAKQLAEVALIDDDALPYKDVSESDLVKFATYRASSEMKIIFIANPKRAKTDPFLMALAQTGMVDLLPLRYFVDPERASEKLIDLITQGSNGVHAKDDLAAYPNEPRKNLRTFGKKPPVIPSALDARKDEHTGEEEADHKMDESAYFENLRKKNSNDLGAKTQKIETKVTKPDPPNQDKHEAGDLLWEVEQMKKSMTSTVSVDTKQSADKAILEQASPTQEHADKDACPLEDTKTSSQEEQTASSHCKTFAITSTQHGIGATHLALSLSFYLAQIRPTAKICCLIADKAEYDSMTAGGAFPLNDVGYPTYKGVSFLYMGADYSLDDFDFAVFDCGLIQSELQSRAHTVFVTANRRFIVASGAPWAITDITTVLSQWERAEYADCTWCFFGAAAQFVAAFEKLFARQGLEPRIFTIPYNVHYLEPHAKIPNDFRILVSKRVQNAQPSSSRSVHETSVRKDNPQEQGEPDRECFTKN